MKNPLNKLLADNRGKGIFRAEAAGDEATVYLYDIIVSDSYWGGVSALDFAKQLTAIDAKTIHLRINSPGGEVFAGQAMAQTIREHGANIIAHVDGYAASAASWIALACDEVVISEGGMFMIHKAMTVAWGNADDMKETASLLDKVDAILVKTYAKETGQEEQQILDWMAAETWFNADEAIAYGFADRIAEAAPKNATQWNLTAWAKAPPPAAVTAPAPVDDPVKPEAVDDTTTTEHLRRRLKLAECQPA